MSTQPLKSPLIYRVLIPIIIALTGFLCYSNVFNSFFLSDDFVLIALFDKLGPFGLWVNQQHGQSLFFRPLLSLISFWDYQLWGLNPFGYHLTNFGFHLANAVLVRTLAYLLMFNVKIEAQQKTFLSYFSGFIFLLLPSHSEAVSWISARTDVIATFFALLSFVTYLNYKYLGYKTNLIVSILSFLAALYCKESIVSYPGLIIGYEFYESLRLKSKVKSHLGIILLYLGGLGFYFITRYLKLGTLIGGYGENIHLNFSWIQLAENLIIYPTRIFLPPQPNATFLFWIIAGFILLGFSLLSLALCSTPKLEQTELTSIFIFLMFAFLICILPVINVSVSPVDTQGERYLYWASGFTSIYLGLIFIILISKISWNLVLSSILLIYFGLSLYGINQNWKIAGDLSQKLLISLQNIPQLESVIITSIPDNYRGAYLYRTGLIHGLYLFDADHRFNILFERRQSNNQPFEKVRFYTDNIVTVMTHTLLEKTDQIFVQQLTSNSYQFSLSNPNTYFFITRKNTLETSDYQVTEILPQLFTLKLNNPKRDQDLLLYSSGQFMKVLNYNVMQSGNRE